MYTLPEGNSMTTKLLRTVAYLQHEDRAGLEKLSKRTGASISKLIEMAVQQYLKGRKGELNAR